MTKTSTNLVEIKLVATHKLPAGCLQKTITANIQEKDLEVQVSDCQQLDANKSVFTFGSFGQGRQTGLKKNFQH